MSDPVPPLLQCQNVDKSFIDGPRRLDLFKGVQLVIEERKSVSIIGRSGSGKTTLLHIIAGLEAVSGGRVLYRDQDIERFSGAQSDTWRLNRIGMIFQFHFLLPDFTACENVAMPCLLAGTPRHRAIRRAMAGLASVGLEERSRHLPAELSGGERQRVAIARALANQPDLIIADEPTGQLDDNTAQTISRLLFDQCRTSNTSLVLATHDRQTARKANRCFEIHPDGLVEVKASTP